MRAMLASFAEQIPDVSFTLLYQFRDRSLRLGFKEDVDALPIVLPAADYLRALIYTALRVVALDKRWILPKSIRPIVAAYDKADLVVSAPGGPYFGDIYINHEIVHWWYILLARLFRKPAFLYATSAGPFESRWMNPIRKRLYRIFDRLVTREELSADYIKGLLGRDTSIAITADSAIQASFEPFPREEYFRGDRSNLANRVVIAVSLNDYRYPDSKNVELSKQNYNKAMLRLLTHISSKHDVHYLLLPQLYGKVHDDAPYLRSIAEQLPQEASWEVVSSEFDSDMQRQLFAMSDLHIASRYHPAIFGNTAFVPGLCIYYEHKAVGFMRQLGLEQYAFDINTVDGDALCAAMDEIMERREEIRRHLHEVVPLLQDRSAKTTRLAVELLAENP